MRKPTVPAVAASMRREQPRLGPAPEVARERPAEDHEHDGGSDAGGRVHAEEPLAHHVREDRQREQRHDEQQLAPRAAGALERVQGDRPRPRAGIVGSKRGVWRGRSIITQANTARAAGFHAGRRV